MSNAKRRILIIVAAVSACVLMAVVGYAATRIFLEVKNNYFKTGVIDINLNDGNAVISADEFLFEPGATIVKEFFLENTNQSSDAVYYRFYVQNVTGDLAKHLQVTIKEKGGETLATGSLKEFESRTYMDAPEDPLAIGDKQWYEIYFHMPKTEVNDAQKKALSFEFSAVAVQSKNNTGKEFE